MIDAPTLTNILLFVVGAFLAKQDWEMRDARKRLHRMEGSFSFIEGFLRGKGIIPVSSENTSD